MVTRWIVLAVAITAPASVAEAGVSLVYTPTDLVMGESTAVQLSLVGSPGLDTTIGAVILDFGPGSDLAELNPTGFDFDPVFVADPWTSQVTLPNVVQSVWGGAAGSGPALLGNQSIDIGSILLTPTALGSWLLDGNLQVFNSDDFDSITVDGGDPTRFNVVVPEPASIALLAMGATALVRRKRR